MKVVILAAGLGSRLGDPNLPKTLTHLANGKAILGLILDNLSPYISLDDIYVVVGYRKEKIIEAFPRLHFIDNPHFAEENTSKSLLRALNQIDDDLLWINGDVVFHRSLLDQVLAERRTGMVVNVGSVGEEEVKYRTDGRGTIVEVSKKVISPEGEALGINFVTAADLGLLRESLLHCHNNDYFEKGIELAIGKGLKVAAFPVDSALCAEVDFPEDLVKANKMITSWNVVG